MMRFVVVIMTGVGFTFGILFGLFLQLPAGSLPADNLFVDDVHKTFRFRRSLSADVEASYKKSGGFQRLPLESVAEKNSNSDSVTGLKYDKPVTNSLNDVSLQHGNKSVRNERVSQMRSELRKERRTDTGIHHTRESISNVPRSDIKQKTGESLANESKFVEKELEYKQDVQSLTVEIKVLGAANTNTIMKNSNAEAKPVLSDVNVKQNSYKVSVLPKAYSGIYWNSNFTRLCPAGFTGAHSTVWRRKSDDLQIVKVEEGCGRMQNRLLTFSDASKACARYRLNVDQIQGEIYSYYLAKLLNMTNLPPTFLLTVNSLDDKWKSVHLDLRESQWADDKVVILTQWVSGLFPAYIPPVLQKDNRRLHPTEDVLGGKTREEMCELVQWSDLIVFDYLTANLDRVVNNMFNKQWNDQMMSNPAHNLEKTSDGSLVFLDNESGLFHGYRLLDKYSGFHKQLLSSLCVFRESTAQRIRDLHQSGDISNQLHKLFYQNEKLHLKVPDIPEKNIKILKRRIADVFYQIQHCESQYGR